MVLSRAQTPEAQLLWYGGLVGCMAVWPYCCLTGWLAGWLADWLTG